MKKTRWFSGNVKPARVGVYQRKYAAEIVYCRWDGELWFVLADTARDAAKEKEVSMFSMPWRGLAEKPE